MVGWGGTATTGVEREGEREGDGRYKKHGTERDTKGGREGCREGDKRRWRHIGNTNVLERTRGTPDENLQQRPTTSAVLLHKQPTASMLVST